MGRSNAETLGIVAGSRVWLIGGSLEAAGLLDPLPHDVDVLDAAPHPAEHPSTPDVALLVVDHESGVAELLDDVLPRLGSVPAVWIVHPDGEVDPEPLIERIAEYGWEVRTRARLDDAWAALRLTVA